MQNAGKLTVTLSSDREVAFTRVFAAPRRLVFDAWTKPELVRRWLLGPPGWTMPVCEIDLRVGGRYRFVWQKDGGIQMGIGGAYLEIDAPGRLVSTEKFDESWYPGEAVVTNVLTEKDGRTTCTFTIRYESKAARDIARGSGMDQGMEAGFARLDELLAKPA